MPKIEGIIGNKMNNIIQKKRIEVIMRLKFYFFHNKFFNFFSLFIFIVPVKVNNLNL